MKSRTTIQFRRAFGALPEQVQEQTRETYRQFRENPAHPSLRFKKVHPEQPVPSVVMLDLSPLILIEPGEPAACTREKIMKKVAALFPENSLKWNSTRIREAIRYVRSHQVTGAA